MARDEQREGEGCQEGGLGVLQREIPSITPWASYIRDYFSFLSPDATHHPPLLFSFSCLPFLLSLFHLFLLEATSTCQQVSESVSRGMSVAGGNVQKSSDLLRAPSPSSSSSSSPFYFPPFYTRPCLLYSSTSFLFLRNYRKLVPWRGRFVIRLILSQAAERGREREEDGGKEDRRGVRV